MSENPLSEVKKGTKIFEVEVLSKRSSNCFILTPKKKTMHLAERGFDPRTSGLWAQHACTAQLCFTCYVFANDRYLANVAPMLQICLLWHQPCCVPRE